jgi:hypothetical protein
MGLSRSEAAALPVSPALWAAQQRLLELRKQRQVVPVVEFGNGRSAETTEENSEEKQRWQTLVAEQVETAADSSPTSNNSLKLYPSLALAILRQEQVATGRIWLLLRH